MTITPQELRQAAADAMAEYRGVVLAIAAGEEFTPEHCIEVAQRAGRTLEQLAADIETASQRRDAITAYEASDPGIAIERLNTEYSELATKLASLKTEYEELGKTLRHHHEAMRSNRHKVQVAKEQQKTSHDEYQQFMSETAGPGRNPYSDDNFRLA